jgi:hypothetical protein
VSGDASSPVVTVRSPGGGVGATIILGPGGHPVIEVADESVRPLAEALAARMREEAARPRARASC